MPKKKITNSLPYISNHTLIPFTVHTDLHIIKTVQKEEKYFYKTFAFALALTLTPPKTTEVEVVNRLVILIGNNEGNNNNNKQIGSVTAFIHKANRCNVYIHLSVITYSYCSPVNCNTDCIYKYNISFKKLFFFSNNMCSKSLTLFVLIVKYYV